MTPTEELFNLLKQLGKFELVSGDSIHRTNPESKQLLNDPRSWIVCGDSSKSQFKLKLLADRLNELLGDV